MRCFKLTIAYDGTDYAGWQVQPQRRTIQAVFEAALAKLVGQPIRVTASGRTDAGVHARGQTVSFSADTRLPPEVFRRALNATLPRDVVVLEAAEAEAGFEANRHAIGKRYRYVIDDGPFGDVFARRYCWHHRSRLDAAAMDRAAQALGGRHDFAAFQTQGSPRLSTVRTVCDISVRRGLDAQSDLVITEIEADGFLYNMVRAIVGTLVEVGRAARGENWIAEVLRSKDRHAAGRTAPPQGLFLMHVKYGDRAGEGRAGQGRGGEGLGIRDEG
jgi:tRNA pseudouridine38-40 synthase